MGRTTNKIRQAFNIFLIFALIAVVTGVSIWFLTTPEQRGATFWMSMGFLGFALLLQALFAMKIAFRTNSGRDVPASFSQSYLLILYFIFVVGVVILNAFKNFSVTIYLLIHVIGAAIFLIPLLLSNMMMLRMSGADRKEQQAGRQNLSAKATKLRNKAALLEMQNVTKEQLTPILQLADALQYSDPNPASKNTEAEVEQALAVLEEALSSYKGENWQTVQMACLAAKQALEARNTEVRNTR